MRVTLALVSCSDSVHKDRDVIAVSMVSDGTLLIFTQHDYEPTKIEMSLTSRLLATHGSVTRLRESYFRLSKLQ